jgi:hypothetical protein
MTIQELLDKLEEIKQLAIDLPEQENLEDKRKVVRIEQICEDAILEWKIERRLKNEA